MGAKIIVTTLEQLTAKALTARTQDESNVTYAAKLTKEMEWLDPAQAAVALERQVRGLYPWPGTSLRLNGQRLKIKRVRSQPHLAGAVGQLFERGGMLLLGTAEGSLEILAMQWEGKKATDPRGFLNGLKNRGESLPILTDPILPVTLATKPTTIS